MARLPAPHTTAAHSVTPSRNGSAACNKAAPAIIRAAADNYSSTPINCAATVIAAWAIAGCTVAGGIIATAINCPPPCINRAPTINRAAAIKPSAPGNKGPAAIDASAATVSNGAAAPSIGSIHGYAGTLNNTYA